MANAGPVHGGISFGHTNAVEEKVDELDRKIREYRNSSSDTSSSSTCLVDYPDWLEGVNSTADLRQELLVPDTEPTSPLAVKGDSDFVEVDDGGHVTADTILQRCNTYFRDKNDPDIQHWIYCRAFQLPSGDTYTDLNALKNSSDSAPPKLYTAAFFHGSNVDDPSENWLVPLLNKYKQDCTSRPLNVIWVGVRVTDQSQDPPEDLETLGNKWHVTASAWENTVLFDVMKPSVLNFSGHTTASCPFDSTDTHGLWVGGTQETIGRRINDKFTDQQSMWVGTNSMNQSACYSGVTDGNPVNANDYGVQFEFQVTVPESSPKWVDPETLARYILDEF
jgi:hypothetical protein